MIIKTPEPVVTKTRSVLSTPLTGVKRSYPKEEREGQEQAASCIRAKRFLMSLATPLPRLVLVSTSKGKLIADLDDTV